jgi:hypothetical protein
MAATVDLDQVYAPAADVLAQEVDGELFVLPLRLRADGSQAGVFALNTTGRAVWERLDGCRDLRQIVQTLSQLYEVGTALVEPGVRKLVAELLSEGILVTVSRGSPAL